MEIEAITSIVSTGISALALILSIFLKRKSAAASKTLEDISQEANKVAQKYFEKQCKKNKITVSKSEDNTTNSEAVTTPDTINL